MGMLAPNMKFYPANLVEFRTVFPGDRGCGDRARNLYGWDSRQSKVTSKTAGEC
jgi:hypothetical protein